MNTSIQYITVDGTIFATYNEAKEYENDLIISAPELVKIRKH